MNKFLITNINVSHRENYFTSNSMSYRHQPMSINLELSSVNLDDEAIHQLHELTHSGKYVSISSFNQIDNLLPFKKEFKEFMLEKYPEKILKNPEEFNRLFTYGGMV